MLLIVTKVCYDLLYSLLIRFSGKDINGRRIKLVDDSDGYGGGSRRRSSFVYFYLNLTI